MDKAESGDKGKGKAKDDKNAGGEGSGKKTDVEESQLAKVVRDS